MTMAYKLKLHSIRSYQLKIIDKRMIIWGTVGYISKILSNSRFFHSAQALLVNRLLKKKKLELASRENIKCDFW